MNAILWYLLVGLVAGWLTGLIMKGSGYGIVMDIVLGIAGAIIGGWIASSLGLGGGGFIWSVIIAILGAVILVAIVRLVAGRRRHTV